MIRYITETLMKTVPNITTGRVEGTWRKNIPERIEMLDKKKNAAEFFCMDYCRPVFVLGLVKVKYANRYCLSL